MSEPTHQCENNANFKQNYTQKLFIGFIIAHFCFCWLGLPFCIANLVSQLYAATKNGATKPPNITRSNN